MDTITSPTSNITGAIAERTSLDTSRLETLVIARSFAARRAQSARELAGSLRRFAPTDLDEASWRQRVEAAVADLRARRILDDAGALADPGELERRIGAHAARSWPQLADKILPGLALGIPANDAKDHARLAGRDAWSAAVVAQAMSMC